MNLYNTAKKIASVTPSDTENFTYSTQPNRGAALFVQTGGVIRFETVNGDDITWTVSNESFLPVSAVKVFSTNTTATGIFGLWV